MGRTLVDVHGRRVPIPEQRAFSLNGRWINRLANYESAVALVGGRVYSYAKIYRTQPWVYAVVQKFARGLGQLPLKAYEMTGEDESSRRRIRAGDGTGGDLVRMLANPYPGCTPTHFKQAYESSMKVYGNALIVKGNPYRERGGPPQVPTELYPVEWWRVEVVNGEQRPIDLYVVRDDLGKAYPFTPDEVIHDGYWAPDSPVGISPLEPLRRTLAAEDAAMRETVASLEHAGRPSGVFVTEGRKLSLDEATAIRQQLEEEYGGVDNAYRIAVLGGGLKWEPTAFNHQEQELIPTRKLTREEVAAAYQIDPTQVGILDHATYSNVTEAHRGFYMDSLGPDAVGFEETLEVQLLQPEPAWRELDLEFDMSEVLKADIVSRANAYTQMIRVGMTPDEIRHFENLPALGTDWSRSGYVARELQPLDPNLSEGKMSVADLTVALQKIYLSVGKVINAEEAREILNRAGANLPTAIPDGVGDATRDADADEALRALAGALARVTPQQDS